MNWMDEALCSEVATELFFPGFGESGFQARMVCGLCPVAEACLRYAVDERIHYGIWGGKSPAERREIAKAGA